jgi:hypothetical protein
MPRSTVISKYVRHFRRGFGLTGFIFLGLGGCDVLAPRVCPDWVRPAIEVNVWDGESGQPAAYGARGWAREGSYLDSLRISSFMSPGDSATAYSMIAAMERPGTYEVVVQKEGYQDWVAMGIRVAENSCGVDPVVLQANLAKAR